MVLGGGKDLAAAAGFLEKKVKQEDQSKMMPNVTKVPPGLQQAMLPQHFDFMRGQQSEYR